LAQARRRIHIAEEKRKKEELLKEKVENRLVAIKQAEQKEIKPCRLVESLKTDKLITTIEELNRVNLIFQLSIPRLVKEAEVRNLVKRQTQIRSCVYRQQLTLHLSHKGVNKSTDILLEELRKIIISKPISALIACTSSSTESVYMMIQSRM
jgi:hypothetical protein